MGVLDKFLDRFPIIQRILWEIQYVGQIVISIASGFLFFGPVLFMTGMIFMFGPDTRNIQIGEFNSAVTAWNTTYYPVFSESSLQVFFTFSNNNNNYSYEIGRDYNNDDVIHDSAEKGDTRILPYSQFKFNQSNFLFLNNEVDYFNFNLLVKVDVWVSSDSIEDDEEVLAGSVYLRPYLSVDVSMATGTGYSPLTDCSAKGGIYSESTSNCTFYYIMKGFCVSVYQNTTGNWVLNTTTPGCLFQKNIPYYDAEQGGGVIGNGVTAENYVQTSAQPNPSVLDGTITATVRDQNDPYISLSYLTNGSFNFGITKFAKQMAAIVLIVIGVFVALPFFFVIIREYVYYERKDFNGMIRDLKTKKYDSLH